VVSGDTPESQARTLQRPGDSLPACMPTVRGITINHGVNSKIITDDSKIKGKNSNYIR